MTTRKRKAAEAASQAGNKAAVLQAYNSITKPAVDGITTFATKTGTYRWKLAGFQWLIKDKRSQTSAQSTTFELAGESNWIIVFYPHWQKATPAIDSSGRPLTLAEQKTATPAPCVAMFLNNTGLKRVRAHCKFGLEAYHENRTSFVSDAGVHDFGAGDSGWGAITALSADSLLNPNNGFIDPQSDSLTVVITVTVIADKLLHSQPFLPSSQQQQQLQEDGAVSLTRHDKFVAKLQSDWTTLHDDTQLNPDREFSDVSFKIGVRTFHAHRAILARRSAGFKTMFGSVMLESKQREIVLPEESEDADAFAIMLRYIYTGDVSQVPLWTTNSTSSSSASSSSSSSSSDTERRDCLVQVLDLAHRYELGELKLVCEQLLIDTVTQETLLNRMITADLYQIKGLSEACHTFLSKHPEQAAQRMLSALVPSSSSASLAEPDPKRARLE